MSRLPLQLVILTLALGCTGPDLENTMRECGLLTEGVAPALPFYAPTECYEECLAEASCAELEETLCGASIALRRRCDERCAFRCGDDSLIGVEQVCDGLTQCEDESDELGCAVYTCADGTTLTGHHRCDGARRCPDGSDERDCPSDCGGPYAGPECGGFQCDDGTTVYLGSRCNGWVQCVDGSDELGCAEFALMCE